MYTKEQKLNTRDSMCVGHVLCEQCGCHPPLIISLCISPLFFCRLHLNTVSHMRSYTYTLAFGFPECFYLGLSDSAIFAITIVAKAIFTIFDSITIVHYSLINEI